jgi:hypothetical protein
VRIRPTRERTVHPQQGGLGRKSQERIFWCWSSLCVCTRTQYEACNVVPGQGPNATRPPTRGDENNCERGEAAAEGQARRESGSKGGAWDAPVQDFALVQILQAEHELHEPLDDLFLTQLFLRVLRKGAVTTRVTRASASWVFCFLPQQTHASGKQRVETNATLSSV